MKKTFVNFQVVAAYAKAMQDILGPNMNSDEARDIHETIENLRENIQLNEGGDPDERNKKAFDILSKAEVYALDLRFHLKATEDEAFGDFSDYIEDEVNNLSILLGKLADLD